MVFLAVSFGWTVPLTLQLRKKQSLRSRNHGEIHWQAKRLHSVCPKHTLCRTHTCYCVPVWPYPGITMHNSYPQVLSADKSQRLHLLFIENSSHDKSFKKQTTYFISSCCFCFGKDLSGLISRDEGTRGDGDKKKEQRKWGKGIKVGINERLMHQNLICFWACWVSATL